MFVHNLGTFKKNVQCKFRNKTDNFIFKKVVIKYLRFQDKNKLKKSFLTCRPEKIIKDNNLRVSTPFLFRKKQQQKFKYPTFKIISLFLVINIQTFYWFYLREKFWPDLISATLVSLLSKEQCKIKRIFFSRTLLYEVGELQSFKLLVNFYWLILSKRTQFKSLQYIL